MISIAAIEAVLPQTQCRQCGFAGCHCYAQAIASQSAPINRCAPGGSAGIQKLAALLDVPVIALDPDYGQEMPFAVARIDPERCIGCRWCADACPVGAITGARRHLFAIVESRCTGCALCISPCPMDAITLHENGHVWNEADASRARRHFEITTQKRRARSQALEASHSALAQKKLDVMSSVMERLAQLREKTP